MYVCVLVIWRWQDWRKLTNRVKAFMGNGTAFLLVLTNLALKFRVKAFFQIYNCVC